MSVDIGLELRDVQAEDLRQVAQLVAGGMRDNPLHVAAFGQDVARRERRLRAVMGTALPLLTRKGVMIAAHRAGVLVGVAGLVEPGRCRPSASESLLLMPRVLPALGLASLVKMGKWQGKWAKHDMSEPHWHLGPVAVDRQLQRRGIGGALLEEVCARIDAAGATVYLETDKSGNVTFYERYGFETIGEDMVLGVPNWFMKREARQEPGAVTTTN